MRKWLLYAVTGTQRTVLENIIKAMSGKKGKKKTERKKKKTPSELNKTVWLKFKQGWSLVLAQWLSAYAGPRSLCPRPRSLWRARSFYIFTKSEENKLLTHSWCGAEETISLQPQRPRPASECPSLSLSPDDLSCIPVPEASLTFRTHTHTQKKKVKQVLNVSRSTRPSLLKLFFFFFPICCSFGSYIFFLFSSASRLRICVRLSMCVCVHGTIWARAERARVLCQLLHKRKLLNGSGHRWSHGGDNGPNNLDKSGRGLSI